MTPTNKWTTSNTSNTWKRMEKAASQRREKVLRWPLGRRWVVFVTLWSLLTVGGNLLFALCAHALTR